MRGLGNGGALALPPRDEVAESFFERDLGFEAEQPGRLAGVGQSPGHAVDLACLSVFRHSGRSHDARQLAGQFQQACFAAACDVENLVRHIAILPRGC